MSDIIERIKQIIAFKSVSERQFCKEIGVANGFISKVSDVGCSKLNKILYAYPELNPVWLLTGEGEMIKTDDPQPQKNVEPTYIYRENPDKDEIIQLQREQIQLLKEKIANFKKVSTGYVPTPPAIPVVATPDVEAVSVTRIIEHSEEPARRRP